MLETMAAPSPSSPPPIRCSHCHIYMASCRSCGASILWATSATTGSPFPLDFALTTIAVLKANIGSPMSVVRGHVPHHITCPQGREWSMHKDLNAKIARAASE